VPTYIPGGPRSFNRWALAAGIVLVAYGILVGVVLLLWAQVGFYFPGIDVPYPSISERLPALVASVIALGSPLAAVAALVLSIVGLVRPTLNRVSAIVTLILAALAVAPAVFAAIVGIGVNFFAF
jgi:hypothetical protein